MEPVILVNTPIQFNEYKFTSIHFPLNLGYLAAYVKPHGFRCRLWDYAMDRYTPEAFAARVREASPSLMGFSCITPNIQNGHDMAAIAKRVCPDARIVVGGAHGTSLPERTLREFPCFDAVVMAEGEETFLEVCRAVAAGRPLAGIAGVAHRTGDGGIVVEASRPVPADLDALPFPDRELRPPGTYNGTHPTKVVPRTPRRRVIEILTLRGCPYKCYFCAGHDVFQNRTRLRSVENVMQEVLECRERYGLDFLLIQDDTFVIRRDRVLEFCERFAELGIGWACSIRANLVDPQVLRAMARAGCRKVVLGTESGNDETLRKVRKQTTVRQVRDTVRAARQAGIRTVESPIIITSHPSETREQVENTFRLVMSLDLDFFDADILVPYPGSPAYEDMKRRGMIFSEDWRGYLPYGAVPQWRTEHLGPADLLRLQRRFMLRYYFRPTYILRQLLRIRDPHVLYYFFRMALDFLLHEFLGRKSSQRG